MDDWTHYRFDASGNSVSNDTLVAPPVHQQWVAGPLWSRHHDHLASMHAMVSSSGKLIYVFDEGSTSSVVLPPKWKLIARDAFNGTILWKRPLPEGFMIHRNTMIATEDALYLGDHQSCKVIDGETGFLPTDAASWEQALRALLDDPERAAAMGRAGRERIREHYDTRVLAPRIADLIESL